MKYLVISDLHGGIEGTQLLPELLKKHSATEILCCGDILYHGPRNDLPMDYAPKKVIELLNQYSGHIISVRGNCDGEVDQMVLDFPVLSESNTLFLENRRLFMHHGHHDVAKFVASLPENSIVLSGHTHLPVAEKKDSVFYLNPGSITLPKGGHPKTYAILTDTGFTIYTLDGNEYISIEF